VFVGVSQTCGAVQSALVLHATHLPAFPPLVAHALFGAVVQSAAVHARHVCAVVSQNGVPPEQSVFVMHATQPPVVVSHLRGDAQPAVAVHGPQTPSGWQSGFVPLHEVVEHALQGRLLPVHAGRFGSLVTH
jgi:hypothetical protein